MADPTLRYDDGREVIRNKHGLILCPDCREPMVSVEGDTWSLYCPDCPDEEGEADE